MGDREGGVFNKVEKVFIMFLFGLFLAFIVFYKAALKMPERVSLPVLKGWHLGQNHPPSELIGKPILYLKYEYFPDRNTQLTAMYLIRNGVGSWYMSAGKDIFLVGPPDYWIEYPVEFGGE
jgi:hypothetical protein